MDRKYWESQEISIHWWNMGTKTLDYKGTYKGYLAKKDIKVTTINRNGVKGYHFSMSLSAATVKLDTFSTDYYRCCDDAIMVFLTLLGDKTTYSTPRRDYHINW